MTTIQQLEDAIRNSTMNVLKDTIRIDGNSVLFDVQEMGYFVCKAELHEDGSITDYAADTDFEEPLIETYDSLEGYNVFLQEGL